MPLLKPSSSLTCLVACALIICVATEVEGQATASQSPAFSKARALRADGQYAQARPFYFNAIKEFQRAGLPDSATYAAYRIFDTYISEQDIERAHQYRVDTLNELFDKADPYVLGVLQLTEGRELFMQGDYAACIEPYKAAYKTFAACCPSTGLQMDVCGLLGTMLVHFGEQDAALAYTAEAVEIAGEVGNKYSLGIALHNQALAYSVVGRYHESTDAWERAYATLVDTLGTHHALPLQIAISMAAGYDGIGRIDRALHYVRVALNADTVLDEYLRSTLYSTYGDLLSRLNLYNQAVYWQGKSIDLLAEALPSHHPHLLESKLNLADLYLLLKDGPATLAILEEVEGVHEQHPEVHENLLARHQLARLKAEYQLEFGSAALAIQHGLNAAEVIKQQQAGDSQPRAEMYNVLGLAHIKAKQYDEALRYLSLEKDMSLRMGERHVNGVLWSADARCEALLGAGRPREAVATLREAAQFVAGTQAVGAEGTEPFMLAHMLRLLADEAPGVLKGQDYLLTASTLADAIERGKFLKDAFVRDPLLVSDLSFVLRGAATAAAVGCSSSSSNEVCAAGIRYLDLSRALSLQQRAASALADAVSNMPDSISRRSQQLEQDLLAWRVVEASEVLRKQVLDSLQEELTEHEDVLRRNYPGHYESEHSTLIDIASMEAFARQRQLVLLSFMIDTSAHLLVRARIDQSGYTMESLPFNEEALERIEDFRNLLQRSDRKDFAPLAHRIYQDLFAGMSLGSNIKGLVVSTDESLAGLPFAALLTELPLTEATPMRDWAWLKNSLTIAYVDAWQNLGVQLEQAQLGQRLTVLAPGFEATAARTVAGGRGTDATLLRTPWTLRLVGWLKERFGALAFTAQEATEKSLLSLAREADILHLGTHAILDEKEPLKSYFALTAESAAADEDGRLHAYELYPARVSARLAVLPTCHSGAGAYTDQNGTLSLATAMRAAGCPTVVQSFWAIDDERTNELMQYFYEELLGQGLPVEEALKEAQRRYLAGAREELQHPYYWAGLAVVGPSQQVVHHAGGSYSTLTRILAGTLVLCLCLGFVWMRRRSSAGGRTNNFEQA